MDAYGEPRGIKECELTGNLIAEIDDLEKVPAEIPLHCPLQDWPE